MQSTATAGALIRDLADKLNKRLAGGSGLNQSRIAADANGWPMLFISHGGTETEGNPVLLIRIKNVDAVSKDVFGNQTYAYSPSQMEVAYELKSTGAPEVANIDLITCEWEAFRCGCAVVLKQIANGTAVTETSLNAASAAVTLDNLYWPGKSV